MLNALVVGKKVFAREIFPVLKKCGVRARFCENIRESLLLGGRQRFDLVLFQEHFSDGTGDRLMSELLKMAPHLLFIVVLQRRSVDGALYWMDFDVFECLFEPLSARDLRTVVRRAVKSLPGGRRPATWLERFLGRSRSTLRAAGLVLGVFAFLGLCLWIGARSFQARKQGVLLEKELPLSFRLPYPNPSGIAWDGKNLWICDAAIQTVYRHRMDRELSLAQFFPLPDLAAVGMAWGDAALWTIGRDGSIRRHVMDANLTIVEAFRLKGDAPRSIAWDGKNLWSASAETRKIYRHRMDAELTVQSVFNYPGKEPVGMVWAGPDLWVADGPTGSLYRLRFDGPAASLEESVPLGVHLPGTNKLSGLASDGVNLWTVSEGNGLIFRHPFSRLRGGGRE